MELQEAIQTLKDYTQERVENRLAMAKELEKMARCLERIKKNYCEETEIRSAYVSGDNETLERVADALDGIFGEELTTEVANGEMVISYEVSREI